MQPTKSTWTVTVRRADLAIAAVNFLSYRIKTLIQATFLFFPNRPCLGNYFRELKNFFSQIPTFGKRVSASTIQLDIINHVNNKDKVRKKQE